MKVEERARAILPREYEGDERESNSSWGLWKWRASVCSKGQVGKDFFHFLGKISPGHTLFNFRTLLANSRFRKQREKTWKFPKFSKRIFPIKRRRRWAISRPARRIFPGKSDRVCRISHPLSICQAWNLKSLTPALVSWRLIRIRGVRSAVRLRERQGSRKGRSGMSEGGGNRAALCHGHRAEPVWKKEGHPRMAFDLPGRIYGGDLPGKRAIKIR